MITKETTLGELVDVAKRLEERHGMFSGVILYPNGKVMACYQHRTLTFDFTALPAGSFAKTGDAHCDAIISCVAEIIGVKPSEILSTDRAQHIVWARHVAMYLCRTIALRSVSAIGSAFKRDHCSILHASKRVVDEIGYDAARAAIVTRCRSAARAALQ